MSKCRNCGHSGLFLFINIHTGLCSDCQKKVDDAKSIAPAEILKPAEHNIEIPTVYIGNGMKSKIIEQFDDIELICPDSLPDFSKIKLCDNVYFSIKDNVAIAKNYCQILGNITDSNLVSKIVESLNEKRPIFSRVLGYDNETGEIHVVIAFYRIVNYDYTDYSEDRDESLECEIVSYF